MGCPGQAEGCISEYIVLPSSSCYPIGDNITFEQAALSEPLSIGLYATMLAGNLKNTRIAVLGSGPIGISVMLSAVHYGAARVYMTDLLDERLTLAKSMGAHWTGNPDKEDIVGSVYIGTEEMRKKELSIQNLRRQNEALHPTLELISAGKIKPEKMMTHTFRFDQVAEAFDLVAGYKDGVMKAMINF